MSFFKRAMVYLGLVDVEYDEYEPYDEPAPQPARRPASVAGPGPAPSGDPDPTMVGVGVGAVRTLPAPQPVPQEPSPTFGSVTVQPRSAVVRPITPMQSQKVHVVEPTGFKDAPEIADHLKANQPVIVTLTAVDADLRRRLIDFCSGATYALGGAMEKVAMNVFLLTPTNVEVSAEEKRRLQERGLYRT